MNYLQVKFSTSETLYNYHSQWQPEVGQRVVVPTTVKKDGTVTLTIANVVTVCQTPLDNADKPVIALLDAAAIAAATEAVLALEAAKVA